MIARIATFTGANERTLFYQVVQIACRGGKGSPRNRPVISGAQPTRKAVRPFTKQTKQSLFLPFVDVPAQAIKQPRLVDQEANARDRPRLRLDDNIGKPCQPGVDFVALAAELKRGGVFTLFNTLTLDLATVNRNTSASTGGWAITGGGGIFNWYGNIELIDTTLDNNVASGGVGGGLAILSGGGSIVGSTLSENGADAGAAVYVQGNLSGVNSTFSGNISESAEGIIDLWASGGLPVTADFINCTFAQNVTDAAGTPDALSLDAAGGTIKVENTLILDGCLSTLTSADHNLEPANTCGLTQPNDLPSTPIIYGLLFNNGGPTMTHQIGPATAARNAADYATCMGADVGGVDQRGVSRADPLSRCDIGAYEF